MGYDGSVYRYLEGRNRYNETILGWAGHTNTSGVQGSVEEVLSRVRAHTLEEVVKEVSMYGMDNVWYLVRVNFPDNCYTLNIASNPAVKKHGLKELFIDFKDLENRSVEVQIQGSSQACDRNIIAHLLYSEGAEIRLLKMNLARMFLVNLKKNVFVEEDPTKNCRNYPNPDYASYRDCDDQWMKDTVASQAPGLVPIWLADTMETVTIQLFAPNFTNFGGMITGSSLSDCPLPCSTIYTETRFIAEHIADDAVIAITFSPSVQVTTTDFVKPTLSSFLSAVGGSVGLWLGLGALQAVEILFNWLLPWIGRFRCMHRGKRFKVQCI
jgi:hypothetical protein